MLLSLAFSKHFYFTMDLNSCPVGTTANESQTAILKCTADGNPPPKVTWSKLNSSLPAGRHVIEPSGALIVKDVRSEDYGIYSCRAENLLGSVNATAKLTVQCKLFTMLLSRFSHFCQTGTFFPSSILCVSCIWFFTTAYCGIITVATCRKIQMRVTVMRKINRIYLFGIAHFRSFP